MVLSGTQGPSKGPPVCWFPDLCHLSIGLSLGHYRLVGGISRYPTGHI